MRSMRWRIGPIMPPPTPTIMMPAAVARAAMQAQTMVASILP